MGGQWPTGMTLERVGGGGNGPTWQTGMILEKSLMVFHHRRFI